MSKLLDNLRDEQHHYAGGDRSMQDRSDRIKIIADHIEHLEQENAKLEKQLGKAIYSIKYYCDTELANRIISALKQGIKK
jgi:hypothetical protein